MAARFVVGAALAVVTLAAMPVGRGAVLMEIADAGSPDHVQPPLAPPDHGVQPCYVKGVKCVDLFKHQVEPCDVKQHPCDVTPQPMPAQPPAPLQKRQ